MQFIRSTSLLLLSGLLCGTAAYAQEAQPAQPEPASGVSKNTAGSPSLVIYFGSGSSALRPQDKAVLDKASRAYNEGKPIVMILTGMSDRVGSAQQNLTLSQRRATAVLSGLLDRGIPADRFQVLAKGETELPIPTPAGVAEAGNRRVEITWR